MGANYTMKDANERMEELDRYFEALAKREFDENDSIIEELSKEYDDLTKEVGNSSVGSESTNLFNEENYLMTSSEMDFSKKYTLGQKLYLVVKGEGKYTVSIKNYDNQYERYSTNSAWYIIKSSIVFETEGEMEEYLKENPIHINRGPSEWGYSSRHNYSEFDY